MRLPMILVSSLFAFTAVASGQMYDNVTLYTDGNLSGTSNSVHVWGYTLAPSGSSVEHSYTSNVTVIFPNGRTYQSYGSGSGYNAAQADVWADLQDSDPEGYINAYTDHTAFCPVMGSLFVNTRTWPRFDLRIAFFTSQSTGSYSPYDANNKKCDQIPACTTSPPWACQTAAVIVPNYVPCSGYNRVGYLAERALGTTTWFCSPGLRIRMDRAWVL